MDRHRTLDLDRLPRRGDLVPATAAYDLGVDAGLRAARARAGLVELRRGVYIESTRFEEASAVERHRLRALAVAEQRPGVVFAGISAAIIWGLPIVGAVPHEVVVLAGSRSGRRRNGVHEIVRGDVEAEVTPDGVAATTLVATLIEVARQRPLLTALTMMDASLHTPRFGDRAPLCTIEELRERYEQMLPFPGSRSVLAVIERSTTLAETPLESLSRVRFEELGFPEPELQRAVFRPRSGRDTYLDFAWPEHGVWGEADGVGKYLGSVRRQGERRSTAEIVRDEKRREDEVRAVTKWSCARWDWNEAWRRAPLRAILLEAGLPVTRRLRTSVR